ncbi:MAG: protein kinase [Planctomycetota bacterium]
MSDPLSRYQVERELARGGMGVVYLARDPQLDRQVAIKVILGEVGEHELGRFRREGEVLGRLSHRNIVGVHEGGTDAAGRPFLVLDFLEGASLEARLRTGPLPWEEVAEIGEKLADALAHAHDLGVLHRDLKPANVLLDGQGEPVLTDFGLARDSQAIQRLTQSGDLMGTPSYMPPEQAGGETVDERGDVYGLGATLYALLAGAPPFEGDSLVQVVKRVISEPPPPLAERAPDTPPDLAALVMRTLAKDAADRYPDMTALRRDLQRARRGEPLTWVRPPRPRWPLFLAAALALLGATGGGGWTLWKRGHDAAAAAAAQKEAERSALEEEEARKDRKHGEELEARRRQHEQDLAEEKLARELLPRARSADVYARCAALQGLDEWLKRWPQDTPRRREALARRQELRRDTPLFWCQLPVPETFTGLELTPLRWGDGYLLLGDALREGEARRARRENPGDSAKSGGLLASWTPGGGTAPEVLRTGLSAVTGALNERGGCLLVGSGHDLLAVPLADLRHGGIRSVTELGNLGRNHHGMARHPQGLAFAVADAADALVVSPELGFTGHAQLDFQGEAVAFSPNGDRLYVAYGERQGLESKGDRRRERRRRRRGEPREGEGPSSDALGHVRCLRWPGLAEVYDVDTPNVGFALAVAPDGSVAVGLQLGQVHELGPTGQESVREYVDPVLHAQGMDRAHDKILNGLALSPDGTRLFSAGDESLAEWERPGRKLLRRIPWPLPPGAEPGARALRGASVTWDGERLLVGTKEGVVLIYAAHPETGP